MPKIHCLQYFFAHQSFQELFRNICTMLSLALVIWSQGDTDKYHLNVSSLNRDLDGQMGEVVWVACLSVVGNT